VSQQVVRQFATRLAYQTAHRLAFFVEPPSQGSLVQIEQAGEVGRGRRGGKHHCIERPARLCDEWHQLLRLIGLDSLADGSKQRWIGACDGVVQPPGLEHNARHPSVEFKVCSKVFLEWCDLRGPSVRQLDQQRFPGRPAQFAEQQILHCNGAVEDLLCGRRLAREERIAERGRSIAKLQRQRDRPSVLEFEMQGSQPQRVAQCRTVAHQFA